MKKLLLSTAAVAALAIGSTGAMAESGIDLTLGGYYKGYVGYVDQDKNGSGAPEVNDFGYLQDSEIHFNGETTLDNGLIAGVHFELLADRNDTAMQESYAYLAGDWGRVNAGAEDGAAYLLQVAAPSADSNYDGIRQYINPFNYNSGVVPSSLEGHSKLDYAQDTTGYSEKITYLSPVFSGFQAGVSYTPDAEPSNTNTSFGFPQKDDDTLGQGIEGAVRYEGEFNEVGFAAGAGYTFVEADNAPGSNADDKNVWNVGLDVDFRAFGLGAVYKSDTQDNTSGQSNDTDTIVVGADFTTGPFKLGASWLNEDRDINDIDDVQTDRYTGGVVYTYGPGLTFRGSVSYITQDTPTAEEDIDGFTFLLGTQINF